MSHTAVQAQPSSMLERMMLIRAYEEKLIEFQQAGSAAGTCTSVGQEAAAVGVVSALGDDDLILTNHRSAAHLLARGADPGRMMAEVLGRRTGYCHGKSGSLHISVKDLGVILTSTIVGGELSLVGGVALSGKMLGRPGIATCFFGDGAACEGVFHESLNLAAVWNLPVLYVCENNEWQAFVHRREAMAATHVAEHAAAYGIPARTVDGNDAQAVHAAAAVAADTVRSSGRPYLLEVSTYRLRGHFEPDDQAYVDRAELARWQARDPIDLLARRLVDEGGMSEREVVAMRARVSAQIEEAARFATNSPMPDVTELLTNVYA
jgi:TPP-dependent pyruvate/acetoin dehydrogenase alpha subunit